MRPSPNKELRCTGAGLHLTSLVSYESALRALAKGGAHAPLP
jgi:hypothetical protein